MRTDHALAYKLRRVLAGLHDPAVDSDPFAWTDDDESRERRVVALNGVCARLSSFVYVSRSQTIFKLVGLGVLAPLAILLLLITFELPSVETRAATRGVLALAALFFACVAVAAWRLPTIGDDMAYALYSIPRGWSFSRRRGTAAWARLRERFSYFDRGDEAQEIGARIWGFLDEERRRPFLMFAFNWVDADVPADVPVDALARAGTGGPRELKHRVTRHRHGIFVGMPESRLRIRMAGSDAGPAFDRAIRLDPAPLGETVAVYCREADEVAARQFLSPAIHEITCRLAADFDGMTLDLFPGMALLVSADDFLASAPAVVLNRDAREYETRIRPWIDKVDAYRADVDARLRRIAAECRSAPGRGSHPDRISA